MGKATFPQLKDRAQVLSTAEGIITQNFDRQNLAGTTIMVDGTVYFMLVGLRAGDVAASATIGVNIAGATVTLSKVGLYKKDGTQLAVSADQGTAWQSAGLKTVAFTAAYTVPADDGYYVAVVSKASVTLPTLLRQNNAITASLSGAVGSATAPLGTQATQTDLPSPATIAVGSGTPVGFWVAVS